MATKWTFQPSESGPKLFGLSYESSSPVAMLFWHHGITEHCSRYEKMFSFLSTHGISCHAYDCRGHGQSEPNDSERMHVLFDTLVEDFVELCKQKKAENPGLPCFLGGQSMGGLVSCYAALQNQDWFNGLLITSPAMDVDKNLVLKIQSLLGGPMEAIAPKARIVPAVKVEDMSDSEEVRESIRSDPLICHTNIPVKTARQVEGAMNRLKASYPKFTMPIYGMHGSSDRCTSMRGHKAFMDGVSSTDKTFDEIPGGYHELLMGPQKEECYQKMSTWMLAHTGPKPQIKTPL